MNAQQYAIAAEWDVELGVHVLALGASNICQAVRNSLTLQSTAPYSVFIVPPRNYANTWSGYILDTFNLFSRHLEGEVGLRVDGSALYGSGFNFTTTPLVNPRLRLQLNPLPDDPTWRGLEIHAGTGLYSQVPLAAFYFSGSSSFSSECARSPCRPMGGSAIIRLPARRQGDTSERHKQTLPSCCAFQVPGEHR
jgi:hypothetical protein